MAGIPCPNCGKPCLPGAPVCRWCKSKIPAAVRATTDVRTSPEVEAELREIQEWTGNDESKPIPPVSLRTWIALALAIVGITLGVLVSEKHFEVKAPAALVGGLSALALIIFAVNDLQVVGHRHRQAPAHAAHLFFWRMKSKQWSLAGAALADYPSARARHETLAPKWKELLGASLEVIGVSVTNVDLVGKDAAVASVQIRMRSASAVGCLFFGLLGALLLAKHDVRAFEKLVLRRNDRWYLVNGLPEDRTDRRLIRALQAGEDA